MSQNGLLVYEPGSKALGSNLYWVDRSGKIAGQVAEPGAYEGCGELSPDGQRFVYVKQKGATIVTGTSICSRLANGGGQEEVLLEGNPGGAVPRAVVAAMVTGRALCNPYGTERSWWQRRMGAGHDG